MPEDLQNEQSSCPFSRDNKYKAMYKFVLQKHCDYRLEKCASDVKKLKNSRKQNFEGEANNIQLDKGDTRRSNLNGKCVILILLFVFIMFNKLTCELRFHIAV